MKNTIASVAQKYLDQFEQKTRDNGESFWMLRISDDDAFRQAIYEIHDGRLPNDGVYYRVVNALEVLTDLDDDATEDDATERLHAIESDIYTYDLTAWLARDIRYVEYLERAVSEYYYRGAAVGTDVLMIAQKIFIDEISFAVLAFVMSELEA